MESSNVRSFTAVKVSLSYHLCVGYESEAVEMPEGASGKKMEGECKLEVREGCSRAETSVLNYLFKQACCTCLSMNWKSCIEELSDVWCLSVDEIQRATRGLFEPAELL